MTDQLRMTHAQAQALRALCEHGSVKAAAYALGIRPNAVACRLRKLRDRTGLTVYQLAAWLGAQERDP